MILYHGTNLVIDQIDLSVCRPNKDFGKGFYLTTIEDQAQKMAKRVARLYGGDPTVNVYHFDEAVLETDRLSVLEFAQPSIDWALFVINNRNDVSDGHNNLDFKYDIVIGPVADDDLSMLFSLFSDGFIDEKALMYGMKFKRLTDQYSFHTERAISYLHKERDYIVNS
ncbi:MAG: DUF3990 domain-containing protein [Clostridia bacterium]|nr:DUF3990 domain-containing protein [Clostridia bacterium]